MYLVIVLSLFTLIYFYTKTYRVKNVAILPYNVPFIGHSFRYIFKDVFSNILYLGEQSLKNNGMVTLMAGPLPIYIVSDPGTATLILNSCAEKSIIYQLSKPLFGDMLMTASASTWKRNRKYVELALKPQVLDSYQELFNRQAHRLLRAIDSRADGDYIDIMDEIVVNGLETACITTLGPAAEQLAPASTSYARALDLVFEIVTRRATHTWLAFDSVFRFSKSKKTLEDALDIVFATTEKVFQKLRKSDLGKFQSSDNNEDKFDNAEPTSFLDVLLRHTATPEGSLFTERQLRCFCDNVLPAAFDTSVYETLLTLVCIGSCRDVQSKLYQEIQEVLGDETTVSKEHLKKLVYLEAVVKETIRLYPIGPIVSRQTTDTLHIGTATFPPGSIFAVHLWAINRSQAVWGEDADSFRPERWLDSTFPGHPNAFASFSFGKRNCPGRNYTIILMKTILVPILRKYRITADRTKLEFVCNTMLKPKAGHRVKFELR